MANTDRQTHQTSIGKCYILLSLVCSLTFGNMVIWQHELASKFSAPQK